MKFSTKEDIDAPIEAVFDMLSDFEVYERAAMRRGADIQRTDQFAEAQVGMTWDASFSMRGKPREVEVELVTYDRPNEMVFENRSTGMQAWMTLDLMALSRTRTRVSVALEIKPQNLSARLLVQSLKLAKTSLTKKYKLRVAEYAKQLEEKYERVA